MSRLTILLFVYFVLVSLYIFYTPPFEAPDAYYHFGMVEYISREFALPPDDNPRDHAWEQMVFHAPLYYLVTGVLTAPIDTRDFPDEFPHNPHAKIGLPDARDNKNFVAEGEADWQKTLLAVRIVQLFSALCGAVTLISIYAMGRMLFSEAVALLAVLFVMLNPQFLYLSGMMNNDNLALALSMVTLALLIQVIRAGLTWSRIIILGGVMALASLSKVSTLPLYPTVGIGLLWVCFRPRPAKVKLFIQAIALIGILWAVIAGWWYLRNVIEYGEPFATEIHADVFGRRTTDVTADELEGMYWSFWAVFGWFNITVPRLYYDWMTLILVCGGVGVLWRNKNTLRPQLHTERLLIIGIFAFHALMVFVSWYRFNQMVSASQGRIVFAILGGLSLGVAYGLRKLPRLPVTILMVGMGVGAAAFPMLAIRTTFAPAPIVEKLPENVNRLDVRYGEIYLLGYRAFREEDELRLSLYWRADKTTPKPLSLYIQIFAPDEAGNPVESGKLDTYPSGGLRRTDTWQTGVIYEETYRLETHGDFGAYEPRFKIGWRDNDTGEEILPTTLDGTPIDAVVVRGGSVLGESCGVVKEKTGLSFGGLARLNGYALPENLNFRAGDEFDLRLQWQVMGETAQNLTVFVQLVNPEDLTQIVGSGDGVPRRDWYPTSAWLRGACVEDVHRVLIAADAPSGNYHLLIGFYDSMTGTRLLTSEGKDAYLLKNFMTIGND